MITLRNKTWQHRAEAYFRWHIYLWVVASGIILYNIVPTFRPGEIVANEGTFGTVLCIAVLALLDGYFASVEQGIRGGHTSKWLMCTHLLEQSRLARRAQALQPGDCYRIEGDRNIFRKTQRDPFAPPLMRYEDWAKVIVKNPDGVTGKNEQHFAFGDDGYMPRGATVRVRKFLSLDEVLCEYAVASTNADTKRHVRELPVGAWFIVHPFTLFDTADRFPVEEAIRQALAQEKAQEKAADADRFANERERIRHMSA